MTGTNSAEAYAFLKKRFANIEKLVNSSSILGKDAETAMAKGSGEDRVNQMIAIGSAIHDWIADTKVKDALDLAESDAGAFTSEDRRNLALMRKKWIHEAGLPSKLADEVARLEAEGQQRHVQNYKSGDWNTMRDWYAHSFAIMREVGETTMSALGVDSPYAALIDRFSPGIHPDDVAREFAALDAVLQRLIPEALEKQKSEPAPLELAGPFGDTEQMLLGQEMAKKVGFDVTRGVLYSIKGHPSLGGSSDDCRITTRISENDFLPGLYGTIHETGHAVYQQGLPKEWRYQPVGGPLGMDVHESQSMIMELQAGMSREFLIHLSERLQDIFNRHGDPAFDAENLRRLMWRANPSFIRVDADELTYSMHVLLRHDLESRIIGGQLDARDLPDAWNDGMKKRLGIAPENPSQGCMQDVHWPCGAVGYFPAYTLGAMGAAQFNAAARKARPEIPAELAKGNFGPLKEWLNANVHSKGSLVTSKDLFIQATGEPLNAKPYLNHLSQRYIGKLFAP